MDFKEAFKVLDSLRQSFVADPPSASLSDDSQTFFVVAPRPRISIETKLLILLAYQSDPSTPMVTLASRFQASRFSISWFLQAYNMWGISALLPWRPWNKGKNSLPIEVENFSLLNSFSKTKLWCPFVTDLDKSTRCIQDPKWIPKGYSSSIEKEVLNIERFICNLIEASTTLSRTIDESNLLLIWVN